MCMTITSAQLVVTSCGKVICSSCKPRLTTITCRQCQGPCTRTVALTDEAPKEVTNLFTDISEQLKAVLKNYYFQESQKRSLLEYKEKKSNQMRNVGMEMMGRRKADIDKLTQMKEQLARLERREAELQNYFSSMTSPAPREKMMMPKKQEVFGGGINNEGRGMFGEAQVLGSSGFGTNRDFLDMKTPAVWYHKQKDRVDKNSLLQKLDELVAVGSRDGGSKIGGGTFFLTSPPPSPGGASRSNGRVRSRGSQCYTSPPLLAGPRPYRMC